MAYTPTEWKKGDIVTSTGLNNMEKGIVDAQNGYTIETTETVIVPQQTIAEGSEEGGFFQAMLTGELTLPADGDTVKVTYDGVDYTLTAVDVGVGIMIGEQSEGMPDFTNYPFMLGLVDASTGLLNTETDFPHTVKVTKATKEITVGDDFAEAVKTADAMGEFHINFTYDEALYTYVCDKTFAEILTAFNNGQKIVAHYNDEPLLCQKLNTQADQFSFLFVAGISASGIDVDVFKIATDDTVTQSGGTIAITISN